MRLSFIISLILMGLLDVASLLFVGCSKEEVDTTSLLRFTSILNLPTSRSTNQSLQLVQFEAGEKVGIYVSNVATTTPLEYTSGINGALLPISGLSPAFPVGGLYIYSIYPFQPSVTIGSIPTFSVKTDQSTDANFKASDLMFGAPSSNPVAKTSAPVPLTYKHLLTKININLISGLGAPDLNGAIVRVNGTKISTTYNPMNGSITASTGNAIPITAFTSGSTATSQKGSVIIIPQTVYKDYEFIEVKLSNGISLSYVLPATITFTARTEYTYNVTVNNASLDVESNIAKWGVGASYAADAYEYIQPSPNCFVVSPSVGTVTIPITNVNIFWGKRGDGAIATIMGNRMPPIPTTADLAYEVTANLITNTNYVAEVIWSSYNPTTSRVRCRRLTSTGFTVRGLTVEGNVVVGVRKSNSSNYLWSWHIWVTSANLDASTVTLPSGTVTMDRNLGALTNTAGDPNALGLLYQWGRKDPFPGSASVLMSSEPVVYDLNGIATTTRATAANGTLLSLVSNPFVFYTSSDDPITSGYLTKEYGCNRWGGAENNFNTTTVKKNKKSLYDPCPAGWRIPWGNNWSSLQNTAFDWNDTYKGRFYGANIFTSPGCRVNSNGALAEVGEKGIYWGSSPAWGTSVFSLKLFHWYYQTDQAISRSESYSIRPVKE